MRAGHWRSFYLSVLFCSGGSRNSDHTIDARTGTVVYGIRISGLRRNTRQIVCGIFNRTCTGFTRLPGCGCAHLSLFAELRCELSKRNDEVGLLPTLVQNCARFSHYRRTRDHEFEKSPGSGVGQAQLIVKRATPYFPAATFPVAAEALCDHLFPPASTPLNPKTIVSVTAGGGAASPWARCLR